MVHAQVSPELNQEFEGAIVNGRPDSRVYVAEPLFIAGRYVFPSDLTPEQRQLFDGFIPAEIPAYPDVSTFLADERPAGDAVGTLNFIGFFQAADTIAGLAHKSRAVYRRLQAVAPELVLELEALMANVHSLGELDQETQEVLFHTYNLMAQLVEAEVDDPDYLKR